MRASGSRRAAAAGLAACLLASAACTSDVSDPGAEPRTPVDRAALADAVGTYLEGTDVTGKVRAVLVEVDGEVVLEHYVDAEAEDFFDTRSVTKSVVATAVGVAIEQGHLDGVDQTLGELLPAHAEAMSPAVADVTLEQVLTHTAGFPDDETPGLDWWTKPDRVAAVLAAGEGPSDPPRFAYSSGGSHLLAAVLAEATDRPVLEYVGEEVLDPLGVPWAPDATSVVPHDIGEAEFDALYEEYLAADFLWPSDGQGIHDGGCCMRLRPADLLALGRLYLHGGEVDGEQVVPASWVEASTRAHVAQTGSILPGYGYQWWTTEADDHPAFVAFGFGGQMVEVVPSQDLVVAVMTEIDDRDPSRLATLFGPDAATYMVELVVLPHVGG